METAMSNRYATAGVPMTMPTSLTDEILETLEALVGMDTTNPPRDPARISAVLTYVRQRLTDLSGSGAPRLMFEERDLGDGCQWLLISHVGKNAHGSTETLLFNVHLDTVPACEGWSADPFKLRLIELASRHRRATGLGSCDIKGAAAGLIAAFSQAASCQSLRNAALLFTTDEEAGSSRCVRTFLDEKRKWVNESVRLAVIAEPTGCRVVTEHRGLATASGVFTGVSGHGSASIALENSAIHEMVRWADKALAYAHNRGDSERNGDGDTGRLQGIRFNIGMVDGGKKSNMIADRAQVRFGVRPAPLGSRSTQEIVREIQSLAPNPERVTWMEGFNGPALPPSEKEPATGQWSLVEAFITENRLKRGAGVDFWTEAALFSEAGVPAVVLGPGHIAQAHTADEWVDVGQLTEYAHILERLMSCSDGLPRNLDC